MNNEIGYSIQETHNLKEEHTEITEVHDLCELLHSLESIYALSQRNPWIPTFLRRLRQVLKECPDQDLYNIISSLKERSTRPTKRINRMSRKRLAPEELKSLTVHDLISLISDPNIQKEELLRIGEVRLGIPKGSSRQITKENLRARIQAAIENVETMAIIGERAAH